MGQGQSHSAERAAVDSIAARSDVQRDRFIVVGPFVVHNGRWYPRVRGAESDGGAPAAATADTGTGGESGQGEGLGLYDLADVPEHLREVVEPIAKKIGTNANRKIEEQATALKRFEPISAIEGLTDVPADELTELLQFRNDVLSNEEAFKDWWLDLGKESGWLSDDGALAGGDGGEGDGGAGDDPEIAELKGQISELTEMVQELVGWKSEGEQGKAQDAAKAAIESELKALGGQELGEGKEFEDDVKQTIIQLALAYGGDPDAIKKGFADYQRIAGKAETSLLDGAGGQPPPSNSGGRPDTAPAEITSFAEARRLAKERARAAVGT